MKTAASTKKPRPKWVTWFLRVIQCLVCLGLTAGLVLMFLHQWVVTTGRKAIVAADQATGGYDAILVLGCRVNGQSPSDMLADRMSVAVDLYHRGLAPKILVSGDHGTKDYDEVNVMKQYAIDHGVPSQDIFMDHAGFSTYDSVYRARDVFCADSLLVVTQEYHLPRALFLCKRLGIEANGVSATLYDYGSQSYRDAREVLARIKDAAYSIVKPAPTYLGDTLPVSGNGDVTNDQ